MNPFRHSFNIASLFAVATVGLVSFAAISQECAGKKFQSSETSFQSTPDRDSNSGTVRAEFDRDSNFVNNAFQSDASTDVGKTWKLVAIALAVVGGSSTAFLAYKAWASRQSALTPITQHPELEHPELLLTQLPREALPEVQSDQESVRSEQPILLKR